MSSFTDLYKVFVGVKGGPSYVEIVNNFNYKGKDF